MMPPLPYSNVTLKKISFFKLNLPFSLPVLQTKTLFPIFSFLNQTNLEKEPNLCQTELEADLGKMEMLNRAPSADPAQVFLTVSPAVNASSSAVLPLFCGVGRSWGVNVALISFNLHGFLTAAFPQLHFCFDFFWAWLASSLKGFFQISVADDLNCSPWSAWRGDPFNFLPSPWNAFPGFSGIRVLAAVVFAALGGTSLGDHFPKHNSAIRAPPACTALSG